MWYSGRESIFLNQNLRMILSVILKIERENVMKPQSKHLLLVNWNIENMYSSYEDDIFLTQIKVRRRNNLAIMWMPFYMILQICKAKDINIV